MCILTFVLSKKHKYLLYEKNHLYTFSRMELITWSVMWPCLCTHAEHLPYRLAKRWLVNLLLQLIYINSLQIFMIYVFCDSQKVWFVSLQIIWSPKNQFNSPTSLILKAYNRNYTISLILLVQFFSNIKIISSA